MNTLKNIVFIIISGLIIISSVMNIRNQYVNLEAAKKKNQQLAENIINLKNENKNLLKKIEYATSSAFLQQQARDKFGLGKENDAWIIIPEEDIKNLYPEKNVDENKTILNQWIDLFTR